MDDRWQEIWDLVGLVNKCLEPYKAQKQAPRTLLLTVELPKDHFGWVLGVEQLATLFRCGKVALQTTDTQIAITVTKADGTECARCKDLFEYYKSRSAPSLCERCDRI